MLSEAKIDSPKWSAPTPASKRNYPLNCWWVAAFSSEVTQTPMERWLLDVPVLLYRTENGHAVALEGRCPHRGAPLSLGCRKGDAIQCGYHGFTFASSGECIQVPSMKAAVASLRIRSYPIVERGPLVWVYLGDPAVIDSVPPPLDLEWANDPVFKLVHRETPRLCRGGSRSLTNPGVHP